MPVFLFTAAFRTKRADRTREDGQKSEKQSCTMNLSFLFARLAQSAKRKALNLVVVGSSPTVGAAEMGSVHVRPEAAWSMCVLLWSWVRAPTVGVANMGPGHVRPAAA